jgi:hypothetical protein
MGEIKKVQLHPDTFKKMHNLRMIRFYNRYAFLRDSTVIQCSFLKGLPNDLKFLRWDCFPERFLPLDFCPRNLVTLDMSYSHLELLWEGDQVFHFKLYVMCLFIFVIDLKTLYIEKNWLVKFCLFQYKYSNVYVGFISF